MADPALDALSDLIELHDPEIDVEALIQRIRDDVARLTDDSAKWPSYEAQWPAGKTEADLSEFLQQAQATHDQLHVPMIITPRGRLSGLAPWAALRRAAHELVLFYVNTLASKQILFNAQVVQALTQLARDDAAHAAQTEVAALRAEIARLEQRLAELEQQAEASRPD